MDDRRTRTQTRTQAFEPVGTAPLAAVLGVRVRLVALDAAAALVGIVASTALRAPGPDAMVGVGLLLVAYSTWFAQARLYRSRFITRRADEVRRIVDAGLRSAATVGLASYLLELALDRVWLLLTTAATVAILSLEREVVRRRFAARRASGDRSRRVLLIGDNTETERFAEMFADEPRLGYSVVGQVDPGSASDPNQLTTIVLAAARAQQAPGVIIAATAIDMQSSNRLIRDLVEAGIHVELTSTLADIASDRLTVRPLGRFPVVYIEPRTRRGWRAAAKRLFDLTLSGTALLTLLPVLATIALLVKRDSPGPVLFRQERVGKDGYPFQLLKFRTMVVDAETMLDDLAGENEGAGPLFKMRVDPRITGVGSILRKTSLDELPQLWNVLRGEMSLVGPRPALRDEMVEWNDELYARLRVKPGITGMWQVSGRSATTFEEYTRLDLYYVDNWSLVVDLAILAKTVPAVLSSDGAY
ncbi:MAG: sugar transferase [Acidimicrobiia bacterium]|nr:sugar transferase [Acidimicrobiia bacterium]